MKKILMLIIGLGLGLYILLGLTSCNSHHEEKAAATKFLVTSPVKMDTTITEDYVCQIHAIQHIELRAQERGYLQKIYVDEGQFVKKGQLLFQIMPNLYQAELQKAKAEVNFAEIEYQNTKKLADNDVVSPTELALAKAKLEKANAELSLARVHLEFTKIKAPFDGIIDRFHVREGSLVEEGELLTHLSDNSKMWVYFNVPEAEYLNYRSQVKKGDDASKVNLMMANNKLFEYPGMIETIEADFNNETGNIPFRATFPNPNGLLRHGETGNIQMTEALKGALIIPQKATFEILDKKYVFVVDKEDVVKQREITVGAEMEDLYAVSKGLAQEEKILLEGLRKVRNDEKITFDYEEPMTVLSQLKLYAE